MSRHSASTAITAGGSSTACFTITASRMHLHSCVLYAMRPNGARLSDNSIESILDATHKCSPPPPAAALRKSCIRSPGKKLTGGYGKGSIRYALHEAQSMPGNIHWCLLQAGKVMRLSGLKGGVRKFVPSCSACSHGKRSCQLSRLRTWSVCSWTPANVP